MKKIENYIHGKLVFSSTKEQSVYDPSTGEEISKVVLSDRNDFKNAIESSKKSQIEWLNTTPLNTNSESTMSASLNSIR